VRRFLKIADGIEPLPLRLELARNRLNSW